jgi:hypothetical protein
MQRAVLWCFTFLSSIICLVIAGVVGSHTQFEGGIVVHPKEARYSIKYRWLELRSDYTQLDLEASDQTTPSDLFRFSNDEMGKYDNLLLVPRKRGDLSSARQYALLSAGTPGFVNFPKPNNVDQTAKIHLEFEPTTKNGLMLSQVDELWLKFEDFPPLKLVRKKPVDGLIEVFCVEHISPNMQILLFVVGLTGFSGALVWAGGWTLSAFGLLELGPSNERKSPAKPSKGPAGKAEPISKQGKIVMPKEWNPGVIEVELRNLQQRPPLVATFVDELIKRFITDQDARTAKKRIEFLKAKLEEMKVTQELQGCLDDLKFQALNLEIKQLELEIQKEGLQEKKKKQSELAALERLRDAMKVQLEIASLQHQTDELKKSQSKPAERSTDEIKREKKEQIDREIEKLNQSDQAIDLDPNIPEPDKKRRRNINETRRATLFDELETL